jgi:hypothetical protein
MVVTKNIHQIFLDNYEIIFFKKSIEKKNDIKIYI